MKQTDRNEPPKQRTPHDSANKPDPVIPASSEDHEEALLDEAIMESFPASDPVSPKVAKDADAPGVDAPSPPPTEPVDPGDLTPPSPSRKPT